jgi:hypothetical protein
MTGCVFKRKLKLTASVRKPVQYHVMDKLRPELEVHSTFWSGGEDAGLKQTFLTPGLILGRFKLHGHLLMAFGGGLQIAATHYHQYNHPPIFTIRFPF